MSHVHERRKAEALSCQRAARIAELEAEVERLSRRPDLDAEQCAVLLEHADVPYRWGRGTINAALRAVAEQGAGS